jgi:hypothetical protein
MFSRLTFRARTVALAILAIALVPSALLAVRPSDAEARVVWCAGDPAIVVNGNLVDVNVHVPLARLSDIDYVEVVFHVPSDANVTAVINDSLLFEARPRVVKDLPAARTSKLLSGTDIPVEVIVHHRGPVLDVAATAVASGGGSRLWVQGTSAEPLRLTTWGWFNIKLF